MSSLCNIAKSDGGFKGKSYCRVTHPRAPVADITLPIGGLYQGRSESAPTKKETTAVVTDWRGRTLCAPTLFYPTFDKPKDRQRRPLQTNNSNYVWASAQALSLTKKAKSDRRERGKGLREKRVQRGKPTGKRREGGCRILLRFSFSPLSLSQEVFLFGRQEVAVRKI